jgi:hypothetical protein
MEDYPKTYELDANEITLSLYNELTKEQLQRVVQIVAEAYKKVIKKYFPDCFAYCDKTIGQQTGSRLLHAWFIWKKQSEAFRRLPPTSFLAVAMTVPVYTI